MTVRQIVTSVAASVAAALAGMALVVVGARWWMPVPVTGPIGEGGWTARERAWFQPRGFSPAELDAANDRHFSWTGQNARLLVPALDRSQPHRLTLHVSAGRPAGAPPPPLLTAFVDGVPAGSFQTANEPTRVQIEIPARREAGALVAIDLSNTFVPGPEDKRTLGVMVDRVDLQPAAGGFRVVWPVIAQAGAAVGLIVLGVLLCGVRSWMAAAISIAVAVGVTWLLLHDAAFLGTYATRLIRIAIGVAVSGLAVALLRARWPAPWGLEDVWVAAGLILGASTVKLAALVHPLVTVGDAIFQVHRAQLVHAGNYFFTSITPRPFFEFPYPIALYVAALPLWSWFPSEMDLVRLLRGLTLGADALVGLAIYAAARRQWGDRTTALMCAALWPLARAPFQGLCNANLTNVFGQGLFGVAMGALAFAAPAWGTGGTGGLKPAGYDGPSLWSIGAVVAACLFLTAGFLSHFSTLTVGIPILAGGAVMLAVFGGSSGRRLALGTVGISIAAIALSYVLYYSHFTDTFRTTIDRVATTERVESTRSIAASPAIKARLWLAGHTNDYGLPGWPLLALSTIGAAALVARRRRDGFTLILAGWGLVWIAFSALGILSTVEMRASLASAPVFVCLGAWILGALRARGAAGLALAAAIGALILWDAVGAWLRCLGH